MIVQLHSRQEPHLELGPSRPGFLHLYLAVVPLQETLRDVETKSGALPDAFRREKGLENASLDILRNTGTVVDDLYDYAIELRTGDYSHVTADRNGVERVVDQIHPDLVELGTNGVRAWQVVRQLE
jgi:hypothetical protein